MALGSGGSESSRETSPNLGNKRRGCPSWESSLPRGSACLNCRSRKLKCDSVRPTCHHCAKAQKTHGAAPDDEKWGCTYEELPPGKRPRVSKKMVQTLEDKVADLERQVSQLPPQHHARTASHVGQPKTGRTPPVPSPVSDVGSATESPTASSYSHSSSHTSYTPGQTRIKSPLTSDVPPHLLPSYHSPWLPPPMTLRRIVKRYFESGTPCTTLFSFKLFFHRLARPGTVEYPHAALLHAMVALMVESHGEEILEGQVLPLAENGKKANAAEWHAARARALADRGALTCDRFFDSLQAIILMSHYAYRICRFHDIWQLTGLGARIAVALRLNKMPAYSASYKYEYCTYTAAPIELVRIPRDVSDVSDRRTAFWWIYTAERFASAITSWAHFVQDEDITTYLPSASRVRPDEPDDWHSLSIQSNDFFHSHPGHLVHGLQLFFKATVLLGRASKINSRWPRFGDGVKSHVSPDEMRSTPDFITLERNINEFLISTQFYARDHPGDHYAPFIVCLPHVARILAHEPLIGNSLSDKSILLSVDSAKRIQATIDWPEAKATAHELLPFLTFCWTTAGRCMIRQIAMRQKWNDQSGVQSGTRDMVRLLDHIGSFRSSNTDNAYSVLQAMMQNPSSLLPKQNAVPVSSIATAQQFQPPVLAPQQLYQQHEQHHAQPQQLSMHPPQPHPQYSPQHSPHQPPTLPLGAPPLPNLSNAASNYDPVFRPRPFAAPPNFSVPSNVANVAQGALYEKHDLEKGPSPPYHQLPTPRSPTVHQPQHLPLQPPIMPYIPPNPADDRRRSYHHQAAAASYDVQRHSSHQQVQDSSQVIASLHADQDVIRMAGAVGMGSGIGALAGLMGLSGLDPSLSC